ncbi:MAG TPA: 5-oxoprolinase subunit PxpB [Syntrophales bacterium]|nr:5-oxoprolinase subunit PxpB [Syntrophales bacterium]
MTVKPYGEEGIRVSFGNEITLETHDQVRRCYFHLSRVKRPFIRDIIPSFTCVLVVFDDTLVSRRKATAALEEDLSRLGESDPPPPASHEIPVRYGGEDGPDCPFVCRHTGLTLEELIEIHTSVTYTVFTVGFTPGFPYLGILDERIRVPRLETPRIRVPAGSVGLAQGQTGIYPCESPGGWQIIGRTETELFNPRREPFSLMAIGDKVRFVRL